VNSQQWTNETLIAAMQEHIKSEVSHYKGQSYCWDVVNEALDDDGSFRQWELCNVIRPAHIPLAFDAAAVADPDVKLYYNDYNIDFGGGKASAAQELLQMMNAYGTRINGVGLESHFIVGETPSAADQASNTAAFTALGVEVAVTELDVRQNLPETADQDQQQALDYVSTVTACLETEDCVGVTVSHGSPWKTLKLTPLGMGLLRQILLGPELVLWPGCCRSLRRELAAETSLHQCSQCSSSTCDGVNVFSTARCVYMYILAMNWHIPIRAIELESYLSKARISASATLGQSFPTRSYHSWRFGALMAPGDSERSTWLRWDKFAPHHVCEQSTSRHAH
jgi:Glycosyl hydrolase family 10